MRAIWVVVVLLAGNVARADLSMGQPHSPAQARAWKALAREFEEKARPREDQVRQYARKIVDALRRWDLDYLVRETIMYDPVPDRGKLTRQYFVEHKAELQAAVEHADVDAPSFGDRLGFRLPEPQAGMPGRVSVPFGPELPPPTDSNRKRGPTRHQLELYWIGPLMPEPNGRVLEAAPPGAAPGRWRFDRVTLPYSRSPGLRL